MNLLLLVYNLVQFRPSCRTNSLVSYDWLRFVSTFIFEFVVVCLQFHAKFWGYTKSSGPNVCTFTNDIYIYIYLMATKLFQVQAVLKRKLFAVSTRNIPRQKPIRTLSSAMALAQGKWVKVCSLTHTLVLLQLSVFAFLGWLYFLDALSYDFTCFILINS